MLPYSLGYLNKLMNLDIENSYNLQYLPESIGKLSGLLSLQACCCERPIWIRHSLGRLNKLQKLDLAICDALQSLPKSLGMMNELNS